MERDFFTLLEGGGMRVVFRRQGDRHGHQICVVQAGFVTPLLESVEGRADEPWPKSPALQEMRVERGNERRPAALLVGMAGKSHWSLSADLDTFAGRLVLDAACRVQCEPAWLGSSYRPLVRFLPRADGPGLECEVGGERWRLTSQNEKSWRSLLATTEDDLLAVRPAPPEAPYPRTIRWRYVFGREEGGG